ncbi:uncharacterized protein LOC127796967 [Diospyros lotus]|uniref:uncharacterized protein LOC127796967 n=1 Tax=Diospyros lotus TaxID=55363 RepID=UPI00224EEF10|nr:uncharacterized protein LOC127796967 [Diospyros lotus]
MIGAPLHSDKQLKDINAPNIVEQGVSGSQVPNVIGLELGGELPQTDQNIPKPELQFYTRRQTLMNTINPNIPLTIEQLTSSNDGPSDSTSSSLGEIEELKRRLAHEFEIKDLGPLKYFLGMKFARSKKGIFVNQHADWASSITDRRSTSRYCTFVGGNLVTWRNKKQNVVARSSAKTEFRVVVAHGICEVMWIKRLLSDLRVSTSLIAKVYCDNKAAISIAHNSILHDRTKHVEFKNLVSKLAMEDIFKPV